MQEREIIVNFLQKMATQDNRGTAFPFFYVIMDYRNIFIPDDCGEYYFLDENNKFMTWEEFNKNQEEYGEYQITEEEFQELDDVRCGLIAERSFIVDNTLFLTETDAENHLKQNYYHYSPKAHTYVMHAWRANELTEFLKALFSYFEVKNG